MAPEVANTPEAAETQPFTLNDDGSVTMADGTSISLEELGKGYLRQSDYTRKTQDLAIQRKELQTASSLMAQLEQNPAGTLKALADNLGVNLVPPASPPQPERHNDDWGGDDWDDSPSQGEPSSREDQQIRSLMEAVQTIQAQLGQVAGAQARNSVEAELARVTQSLGEHGIEVDTQMLARFARDKEIMDLDAAAKLLYHEDLVAAQAKRMSEEQGVVDAKRAAGVAVSPTTGLAGETSTAVAEEDGLDIKDAINAALLEHGVTDPRQITFDQSPISY